MREEANTLQHLDYDPWLLAARNSNLLGFPYSGGKMTLANHIHRFTPTSGHIYTEPFAGLAALYWKMALTAEYEQWRLNDIRTAPFFRALATHGHIVEVPARSHEEFMRQYAAFRLGDPTAILLGPYFSYNGGFYDKGERKNKGSVTPGTYEARLRMSHSIVTVTQPIVTAFDWRLVVTDLGSDDFAYFDPPYKDCKVGSYRADGINHEQLVDELLRAPYKWLLSEYEHPVYARLGKPFWRKEVQLRTTNFRHDGGKQKRVECLWRNY
jgi:site-specific DNA-adenine methylase